MKTQQFLVEELCLPGALCGSVSGHFEYSDDGSRTAVESIEVDELNFEDVDACERVDLDDRERVLALTVVREAIEGAIDSEGGVVVGLAGGPLSLSAYDLTERFVDVASESAA